MRQETYISADASSSWEFKSKMISFKRKSDNPGLRSCRAGKDWSPLRGAQHREPQAGCTPSNQSHHRFLAFATVTGSLSPWDYSDWSERGQAYDPWATGPGIFPGGFPLVTKWCLGMWPKLRPLGKLVIRGRGLAPVAWATLFSPACNPLEGRTVGACTGHLSSHAAGPLNTKECLASGPCGAGLAA